MSLHLSFQYIKSPESYNSIIMKIILLFLITVELTVVEARRNETRAAERRNQKNRKSRQKEHNDDDQVIVAVSHDVISLVTADEFLHVKSDSHTEDWEDMDDCDNNRFEDEHGEGRHFYFDVKNNNNELQAAMVHAMIIRLS